MSNIFISIQHFYVYLIIIQALIVCVLSRVRDDQVGVGGQSEWGLVLMLFGSEWVGSVWDWEIAISWHWLIVVSVKRAKIILRLGLMLGYYLLDCEIFSP